MNRILFGGLLAVVAGIGVGATCLYQSNSKDVPLSCALQGGCEPYFADILARADSLGLSVEQRERLSHLADDSAQKRKMMAENLVTAQKKLSSMVAIADTDLPGVHSAVNQVADDWGDLRYSCIRNVIEVRQVLGEEKWDAWQRQTSHHPLDGFSCVN